MLAHMSGLYPDLSILHERPGNHAPLAESIWLRAPPTTVAATQLATGLHLWKNSLLSNGSLAPVLIAVIQLNPSIYLVYLKSVSLEYIRPLSKPQLSNS